MGQGQIKIKISVLSVRWLELKPLKNEHFPTELDEKLEKWQYLNDEQK